MDSVRRLRRPRRPAPRTNVPALVVTTIYAIVALAVISGDPPCLDLVVWSSQEKSNTLQSMASPHQYKPQHVGRRCVNVVVQRVASGMAEQLLRVDGTYEGRRPHVWTPAAETWLELLTHHRGVSGKRNIIPRSWDNFIESPLVIAVPASQASAFERCFPRVGWRDIFALARDPGRCAEYTEAFGRLRLAKTNPTISTSGFHALISTFNAAADQTGPLTREQIKSAAVQAFVGGVESSVVHYATSVGDFLDRLYDEDRAGAARAYVSAIAVEEKQAFEYNRGNPKSEPCPPCGPGIPPAEKLKAFYPSGGTLMADHPYVVLDAIWVTDAHRQAAADFLDHLKSPENQVRFTEEGFRDRFNQGDPNVLTPPLFDPRAQPRLTVSRGAELSLMQSAWSDLRKRANVLILFDVGRSLSRPSRGSVTTLDTAKNAMSAAVLSKLAADDSVGVWTFPSRSSDRPYDHVRSISPVGRGDDLAESLKSLTAVDGNRELYSAIRSAVYEVQSRFAADRINAVVVVSDRDDERAVVVSERVRLLDDLRAQQEGARIRVFTVALGTHARGALKLIAQASKGMDQDASDNLDIEAILNEVISNF